MTINETRSPAEIRLDIKRQIILEGGVSFPKIMFCANLRSDAHAAFISPLLNAICATPLGFDSRMPRMCFVQTFPEREDDQNHRSFWEDVPNFACFAGWAKSRPSPTHGLDLPLALRALRNESVKSKLTYVIPTAVFVIEDNSCPETSEPHKKNLIKNLFKQEALNGTSPIIIHRTVNPDKDTSVRSFFENIANDCMGAYAAFAPDQSSSDLYQAGRVIAVHAMGLPSLLHNLSSNQGHTSPLAQQIITHHGALTL